MNNLAKTITANLQRVRRQIEEAAQRSGRQGERITLVAVTKYVDCDVANALLEAGCVDLGESRPQKLWQKAEALADRPVRWHMIGHLQRNKVRRTFPHLTLLHAGDSLRLLDELDRAGAQSQQTTRVLLEVNVSGDATKHGFNPGDLEAAVAHGAQLQHLQLSGLMAMAGLEGDLDDARADFSQLRRLRDTLQPNCPPNVSLDELSMGMSGDFEVAIEEGATMVRVGSALFEGVD